MGGWGGCRTCSDVFSTDSEAAGVCGQHAPSFSDYFHTDGIDLDWEYPSLEKCTRLSLYAGRQRPFHRTDPVIARCPGTKVAEISFAAGGFTQYLETSVDWKKVRTPLVKIYINLMTYDLVGGYSRRTGHHTPLYSTAEQALNRRIMPFTGSILPAYHYKNWSSGWRSMRVFTSWRIPPAMASISRHVSGAEHLTGISRRSSRRTAAIVYHWDSTAQAPYYFNAQRRLFATLDDSVSIRLKTEYAIRKGLGGVMFWQLADDRYFSGGLLDVIFNTRTSIIDPRMSKKMR